MLATLDLLKALFANGVIPPKDVHPERHAMELRGGPGDDASRRIIVFIPVALLGALVLAWGLLMPSAARAVPSYARQTGQECAACHTAFPELTPFGRRFKLNGYTLEGGDSHLPPIAAMVVPTFTNTKSNQVTKPGPDKGDVRYGYNNNLSMQQVSLFYAGKIVDHVGAFIQGTYSGSSNRVSWDNADVRFANTTSIGGHDVIFGISVNNNPTVQDVWNTTPAWAFPYISSGLAPTPSAATILQGGYAGSVIGAGAYTFIDDMVYLELSGYSQISKTNQTRLGIDPTGADAVRGLAPYWRLAIEPNWGNHSLEVGTYGLSAQVDPQRVSSIGTNRVTDFGFDLQYQYIGDVHAVTLRANYLHEIQNLRASTASAPPDLASFDPWSGLPFAANKNGHLDALSISASYIYDHMISVTGGYFRTTGNADPIQYGTAADGVTSLRPNSSGFIGDLSYLPFSHGGPEVWKWANARIGIQYTYYTKFNGATSDVDGIIGRSPQANNTLFLYAWTAF
jgi:hypothetical protein